MPDRDACDLRPATCDLRPATCDASQRHSDSRPFRESCGVFAPDPDFDRWAESADEAVTRDPLWRQQSFRLASYALAVAWADARLLSRDAITPAVASQLYRAVGSIAANLAEGYSRSSGRDRVRHYEYALGSAREGIVWYRAGEPVLGAETRVRRTEVLRRIVSLLLVAIPAERARVIRPTHATANGPHG